MLNVQKRSPLLDIWAEKGYNIYITLTLCVLKGRDDMARCVNEGREIHRQAGGAAPRIAFGAMLLLMLSFVALGAFSACNSGAPSSGGEISGGEGEATAAPGVSDTEGTAAQPDGYTLGGRDVADFIILLPKRADRDEKYAAAIIARAIEERRPPPMRS